MKREFGIDLLKMMAMTMVVAHHVLNAGVEVKVLSGDTAWGLKFLLQAFHCFCYCAVDVFVMATGYIMCRHEFKYIRIFRLWRQVVGYSLALLVIALAIGHHVGWRDVANAILPVTTNQYWFFTQYFALFFTIPFLNKLMESLSRREVGILMVTGLGLLSIMPLIAGQDIFVTKWGYCYLWFMFLYCAGSAIYKFDLVSRLGSLVAVLGLLVGVVVSALGAVGSTFLPQVFGGGARVGDLAYSYTSPSLVLEAVSLFVLFGRMKVKSPFWQRAIAFLAPGTFIVYVVHENGLFRKMVGWDAVFLPLAEHGGALFAIASVILVALLIFVLITLVDAVRRSAAVRVMGLFRARPTNEK
jgi:hypothetical protein